MADDERAEAEMLRAKILAYAEKRPEDVKLAFDLIDESDRGAVLIASALAEELLERLLRAACDARADDLLGGHMAPLGTFSAKILATYSLGMLPAYLHSNLEQLRKLRNHCAHHLDSITFSDPKVDAHLRNMRFPSVAKLEPLDNPRALGIVQLGKLVASLESWVDAAVPLIARGLTRKLLQRLHDSHANGADPQWLFASPTMRPTSGGEEPG